jgi:hypothetical protein
MDQDEVSLQAEQPDHQEEEATWRIDQPQEDATNQFEGNMTSIKTSILMNRSMVWFHSSGRGANPSVKKDASTH